MTFNGVRAVSGVLLMSYVTHLEGRPQVALPHPQDNPLQTATNALAAVRMAAMMEPLTPRNEDEAIRDAAQTLSVQWNRLDQFIFKDLQRCTLVELEQKRAAIVDLQSRYHNLWAENWKQIDAAENLLRVRSRILVLSKVVYCASLVILAGCFQGSSAEAQQPGGAYYIKGSIAALVFGTIALVGVRYAKWILDDQCNRRVNCMSFKSRLTLLSKEINREILDRKRSRTFQQAHAIGYLLAAGTLPLGYGTDYVPQ